MRGVRGRLTFALVALVALSVATLGIGSYVFVDASLHDRLRADIVTAMKARDGAATTALRTADAAIKRAAMDANKDIDEGLVITTVRKSVKNLADAKVEFEKGGRADLVAAAVVAGEMKRGAVEPARGEHAELATSLAPDQEPALGAGEIDGGIDAWTSAGYDVTTYELVEPGPRTGTLVDVRQRSELASGMVAGAWHAEAGTIDRQQIPDGPLTLYCGHGQRAATAASLLERAGVRALSVLLGGPQEWSEATGEPLQRSA